MIRIQSFATRVLIVLVGVELAASASIFHHKKYENPITKDTRQPDKVLFDRAIEDITHGRFEIARITLNTLINTYDQSEYLAKAKLAIADSWYREGGVHGLAEAEAEYKDFELFYPTMPEASEAQYRVCMIHYKQMDKPDRDPSQALRAEDECRAMVVQYPNSKYIPEVQQRLRDIQETLAEGEMRVGTFYHSKGSNPAAANRLARLVDQYPLYSRADEALWELGDSYGRMGNNYRRQAGDAYTRIVRDYPLSPYADSAKQRLKELEMPIPQADPVAYARMKYELEHRTRETMRHRALNVISRGPDVHSAAKSGTPAMTTLRATVPVSVPAVADSTGGVNDVSVQTVSGPSALDTKPDDRLHPPPADQSKNATLGTPNSVALERIAALPQNHTMSAKDRKRLEKKYKQQQKKAAKKQQQSAPASTTAPAAAVPATPASSSSNQ
jgi:outer membrane protein assembly factor BamD